MKKNNIFNPLCMAVLGAACSYYAFTPFAGMIALAVLAGLISLCRVCASINNNHAVLLRVSRWTVFFAAGFALGFASHCAALRDAAVKPGLVYQEITGISGVLLDDPRISASGRGIASLKLEQTLGNNGVRCSAKGTVLVFFPEGVMPRLKEFGRGSRIFVDGNFSEAKKGRGVMFRAASTHVVKAPRLLDQMRTKIRLAMVGLFSRYNWGGLALALLVGIKDNLDSEFAVQYQNAGCSYILALSGMHLAIVSSIIAFLLRKPFGIKAAAAAGSVFILVYIYLVGPQPSLLRAGLSYLIGAAAILFSFNASSLQILGLSFLIQLLLAPLSGGTISFILSYLALAGILLAGEPVAAMLRGRLPAVLAEPLSASLGAFIATMSVTAFFFGNLRMIGIAAGLIMVPLTTFFMIGSIIFLFVQPLLPFLELPFHFGLSVLYMLLEKISGYAAKAPALPVFNMPLFVILSSILPLAVIYFCILRLKVRNNIEKFD